MIAMTITIKMGYCRRIYNITYSADQVIKPSEIDHTKKYRKKIFIKIPFRGALYFVNKAPYLKKSLNYDNYEFRKVNITTISAQSTPKFNEKTFDCEIKMRKLCVFYRFLFFWSKYGTFVK